jgi:ADP-ribosylglycohydrolase
MLGAIAGDIIGSVYEHHNVRHKDFFLLSPDAFFTDDTVLTVALADTLLFGTSFVENLKSYYLRYPDVGFGGYFIKWAVSNDSRPYNSFGNGSAMRVSPVGFAFNDLSEVILQAERSALVTHNHPEGIKGAVVVAAAIFLARQKSSKAEIKAFVEGSFGYDLDSRLDDIRLTYTYNETCQGSVPQAIIAFLESTDYEDAIRNAISIGGDSDTLACITGGIAEAFYGRLPEAILKFTINKLNDHLMGTINEFIQRFSSRNEPGNHTDDSQVTHTVIDR